MFSGEIKLITTKVTEQKQNGRALTDKDRVYFDELISSLVVSIRHIQYLGHEKLLYRNNPFVTIKAHETWSLIQRKKFELYITERFTTPEKFNAWCKANQVEIYIEEHSGSQMILKDNPEFNLIFFRNEIYLDCYGIDDTTEDSKQVKFIISSSNKNFDNAIISYLRYHRNIKSLAKLTDYKIMCMIKHELTNGNMIEKKPVLKISNSPKEYCLAYIKLPIYAKHASPTPTWDNFLSQFTEYNRPLFKAWVYSVFKADDFGRQILWIEGPGYTWKSTISSVIGEILAEYNSVLFNSLTIFDPKQRINLSAFDTCRFAVLSNGLDPHLLQREEILLLTGNDYTQVRKLYENPENKKLFAKILVNSNISPIYNDKIAHEDTRIIHLKMEEGNIKQAAEEWKKFDGNITNRLKKEFKGFLAAAAIEYRNLLLHNGLLNKYY